MIFYVIIAAFAAGAVLSGGIVNYWKNAVIEHKEQQQAAAQAEVDAQAKQIEAAAADKQIDMEAAFTAGEANAKTITKVIHDKGQQLVATTAAFANPACVIGANGLQLVNSARTGVQLAANTSAVDGTVPAVTFPGGRPNGNNVSGAVGGRGTVPSVQPAASGAGGTGQVPGTGARGVPTNPLQPK